MREARDGKSATASRGPSDFHDPSATPARQFEADESASRAGCVRARLPCDQVELIAGRPAFVAAVIAQLDDDRVDAVCFVDCLQEGQVLAAAGGSEPGARVGGAKRPRAAAVEDVDP